MELTHRQETFFLRLLDLYRESYDPIHYSTLAERVGVSPFTAYDMLRMLEEKGFVTSEYRLDHDKTTPGRSEVVFLPTQLTYNRFAELAGDADLNDWESVKSQIMAKIRAGDVQDQVWADELLTRVSPDEPDSLRYCFEVMTLLILRLGNGAARRILVERIPQLKETKELISKSGLLLLGGFVLGLLANDSSLLIGLDASILEHIKRYQSFVMNMEPHLCNRLATRINDMFSLVLQV